MPEAGDHTYYRWKKEYGGLDIVTCPRVVIPFIIA